MVTSSDTLLGATLPLGSTGVSSIPDITHADAQDVATAETFVADGMTTPLQSQSGSMQAPLPESENRMFSHEPGERYEIRDEIGRGGIGRVLRAMDLHLGREVAIKELLPQFVALNSRESVTRKSQTELRFLTEARITGNLEHPGVVPVYEMGQRADGTLYYVMKLVRGQTLSHAIKGRDVQGRLALLPHFIDVCNAIAFAHSHGVIHRDLKPENIMLGPFGETLVLDWGLAKIKDQTDLRGNEIAGLIARLRERDTGDTAIGVPMGTPQYMPPEQALGDVNNIDERSDVYTLGAILYELLTGKPPHQEKTPMQTILAVLEKPVIPPQKLEPDVPPELAAIAMRALSKDKLSRYATAQELVEEVQCFQQGHLVRSYRYTLRELFVRWVARHYRLLLVAIVVLVAVGGAWWYRGWADEMRMRRREKQRQETVLARVEQMVDDIARGPRGARWLDIYTFKLIGLKERVVERRLIELLTHPSINVRRLAARALGGMNSVRAVEPMLARLNEKAETDENVLIEIINALGIIGDTRANDAILATRRRFGQYSALWNQTSLAFKMIPQTQTTESKTAEDYHQLGRTLESKEKYEEARQAYLQALEKDPEMAKTHINLGMLYKRLRMYDKAEFHLSRALEIDSGLYGGYNNRGLLYTEMGKFEQALSDYNNALKLKPDFASTLNNRGNLHVQMGNYKAAHEDFEKALQLQPKNARYLENLAAVSLYMQDFVQAEELYRKAIALDSNFLSLRVGLAQLYFLQKRFSDAMVETAAVLDLDAGYFAALCWKIRLLLELGRKKEAEETLQYMKQVTSSELYEIELYEAMGWYFYQGDVKKASEILSGILTRKLPLAWRKNLFLLHVSLRLMLQDTTSWKPALKELLASDEGSWTDGLLRMFAGDVSPEELRLKAINNQRLLEFNVYSGVLYEVTGNYDAAAKAYRRADESVLANLYEWVIAHKRLEHIERISRQVTGTMLAPLQIVGPLLGTPHKPKGLPSLPVVVPDRQSP